MEQSKKAAEAAKEASWTFLMETATSWITMLVLLLLNPTLSCLKLSGCRDWILKAEDGFDLMKDGPTETQIKDETMMIDDGGLGLGL